MARLDDDTDNHYKSHPLEEMIAVSTVTERSD
jgi:hypothetical protein